MYIYIYIYIYLVVIFRYFGIRKISKITKEYKTQLL